MEETPAVCLYIYMRVLGIVRLRPLTVYTFILLVVRDDRFGNLNVGNPFF